MFGVKVNVTWTKPLTNPRIRQTFGDPFPILPSKEMVPNPVLEITGLDVAYSLVGNRFSGRRICDEEDKDGEDEEEKEGEEEEEEVESDDDVATVESSEKA